MSAIRHPEPSWLVARPIAHRGLHDLARGLPENSMGAALAAVAKGYGIECDVRLSRDGAVFVFHDDSLQRLTGQSGEFRACDAAELERLRLAGGDETIPTLARLLAEVDGAVPLVIELKSDFSGDLSLAPAVAAALGDYAGPVALKSFDPALIAALRADAPRWPLGIVAQSDYDGDEFACLTPSQWRAMTRFTHASETRPDFLSWRAADLPTPLTAFVRACVPTPVLAWTVRSQDQAAVIGRHADQIVFEGFSA
jgi:glycerophosphoryl diester phosphodiesterase